VIKLLLDAGANVDEADKPGDTALMVASGNGHVKTVELLIEALADVNCQYGPESFGEGHTPLMRATKNGHDRVARRLLFAGANVSPTNAGGKTARDIAAAGIEARKQILGMLDGAEQNANPAQARGDDQ